MDLRNFHDYSFQLLEHSFYDNVLGGARFSLAGVECVGVNYGVERASKACRGNNIQL